MQSAAPLAGVRVLDLTRNVAGPFAAVVLADLGAEVIHVERPDGGDDTRQWGPPFHMGESALFLALNRNKRSITLDLSRPEAREVMTDLVARSDVLLESFRPGALAKLGFGPDWARQVNPRLIYCSVTSYGNSGPLRDRPGYDPLMQAFAGLMSVTGEPGRPPVRAGCSINDMGTGMWAAMAVLTALYRRAVTAEGDYIITSLYETALTWVMPLLSQYWADGKVPGRFGSGTGTIVPYRAYPTTDGYLVISAGNDLLFRGLCDVLGHREWSADSRFETNPARVMNREAIDALISEVTREWFSVDLEHCLTKGGIPCASIRTLDQVAADEQAQALGIFDRPAAGSFTDLPQVGLPMTFTAGRPRIRTGAPRLGEHNAAVLAELGFDADQIAAWLASPVFQSTERSL